MHHRKWRIKFFSQGVSYCFTFFIPSSSFKEESMNITTISRLLLYIRDLNFKIFEFKRKFIDSDDIFSGEVLKGSSQEGLREEETWNPECFRCAVIDPFLKETDSCIEIFGPGSKRLHRKETFLIPYFRHLVVEKGGCYQLQLLTHDD